MNHLFKERFEAELEKAKASLIFMLT